MDAARRPAGRWPLEPSTLAGSTCFLVLGVSIHTHFQLPPLPPPILPGLMSFSNEQVADPPMHHLLY